MAASRRKLVTLIEEAATAATPKKEPDAGKVTFSVGGKKPASPLLAADKSRTVMMLRPRTPLLLDGTQSVSSAAKKMHDMNTDAALVIDVTGKLTGIITDTDVTRRVLAKGLDPNRAKVNDVVTLSPATVSDQGTAFDALSLMIEGRFRHLPVTSSEQAGSLSSLGAGAIGVLDVAKCLFDAINSVETSHLPGGDTTVAELLGDSTVPAAISASESVSKAAELMAARKGAVLIDAPPVSKGLFRRSAPAAAESGPPKCGGILTPKDLLFRVVARGLNPNRTRVSEVMTPNPDCIVSTASVLEALHQLQGSGYRQLPVLTPEGLPAGVVDVLSLIKGAMHDTEGSFVLPPPISTEAPLENDITVPTLLEANDSPFICVTPHAPITPPLSPAKGSLASLEDADDQSPTDYTTIHSEASGRRFLFKVIHPTPTGGEQTLRLRSLVELLPLAQAVGDAFRGSPKALPALQYDEEASGERLTINSDSDLREAVNAVGRRGKDRLVLHASFLEGGATGGGAKKLTWALVGVAAGGVLLAAAARAAKKA